MKKTICLLLFLFFLNVGVVNAIGSYKNKNGVEIDNSYYEYLKEFFPDRRIENMTIEDFEKFNNHDLELVTLQTVYSVTIHYNNIYYGRSADVLYEMSEEEYGEYMNNRGQICYFGDDCYETSNKRIILSVSCSIGSGNCGFDLQVNWFNVPVVRSYDVVAFRWSGFSMSSFSGVQYGFIDDNYESTNYSMNGTNSKFTTSGAGISMNLYNDATILEMYMEVTGSINGTMNVYATYQHATSNISLSNSKSYSFSSSGLGSVIYYSNSSIMNIYDGMNGVKVTGYVII